MKISLKHKILAVSILPIALLGLVIIILSVTMIKGSLVKEIQEALKGTAAATLAAYEQNTGDYIKATNGDIWKGGYNISKSEELVDGIKEESGMDVTFFYGDQRIMTSAKDSEGERILASPAGEVIKDKVLEGGKSYFSEQVSLDGVMQYGFYLPVFSDSHGNDPIGMIFVGVNKAEKDSAINKIIGSMIIAILIIMLLCMAIVAFLAISITRALHQSMGTVQSVATGDLHVKVAPHLLHRVDEIGELSRAIGILKDQLQDIIKQIVASASQLTGASSTLGVAAKQTSVTMQEVKGVMGTMTMQIEEQANATQNASEQIHVMGKKISSVSDEVGALSENADKMSTSSLAAVSTIRELNEINEKVEKAMACVNKQMNATNASAQKIKEATAIIASIAEETNLLSLNASIEAARAGESGRGFAVVATQIQKLAKQSNASSEIIDGITRQLLNDTDQTVATITEVNQVLNLQNANMHEAEKVVLEVMTGIKEATDRIEEIEVLTSQLEDARSVIIHAIEALTEIAENNTSSAQEVSGQTVMVTDTFKCIDENAAALKEMAEGLANVIRYFKL